MEQVNIRQRVVDNLAHVDMKLASRVAAPLGIGTPDPKAAAGRLGFRDHRIANKLDEEPSLRMASKPGTHVKTRRVAVLVADGVEPASVKRLMLDLASAGAVCKTVSHQLGSVSTAGGRQMPVDHTFCTMPSVMFDAVIVPGGAPHIEALRGMGSAMHFVMEAYKHCKPICAINEGVELFAALGFALGKNLEVVATPAAGMVIADSRKVIDGQVSQDFIAAVALHRHWERLDVEGIAA